MSMVDEVKAVNVDEVKAILDVLEAFLTRATSEGSSTDIRNALLAIDRYRYVYGIGDSLWD